MKPEEWDRLSNKDRKYIAKALCESVRGSYLISQALYKAIKIMKQEKYPEESNIQDMEMLLELFPLFRVGEEAELEWRDNIRNEKKITEGLNEEFYYKRL